MNQNETKLKELKKQREHEILLEQDPLKLLIYKFLTFVDFVINTLCFVMILYVLYRYNFTEGYLTELLNNNTSFSHEVFKWILLSIGSNIIHSISRKNLLVNQ